MIKDMDRKKISNIFYFVAVAIFFLALFFIRSLVSIETAWMVWGFAAALGMAAAILDKRIYLILPAFSLSMGVGILFDNPDEFGKVLGVFTISASILSLALWILVEVFIRKRQNES